MDLQLSTGATFHVARCAMLVIDDGDNLLRYRHIVC